jgi:hypothetical protein
MLEPSNADIIGALSTSVNFSFADRATFGALFVGSSNSTSQGAILTKGTGNLPFGSSVLTGLIDTSKNNSAFGFRSQISTEGDSNTSFGFESMLFNSLGNQNTAFGANTFDSLTLGDNNIALGFNAGKNVVLGNGNVFLGNNTGVTKGDVNNSIILGNDAVSSDNNQFVVGSVDCIAGEVNSEIKSSTKTWNVVINGVEHKILLA